MKLMWKMIWMEINAKEKLSYICRIKLFTVFFNVFYATVLLQTKIDLTRSWKTLLQWSERNSCWTLNYKTRLLRLSGSSMENQSKDQTGTRLGLTLGWGKYMNFYPVYERLSWYSINSARFFNFWGYPLTTLILVLIPVY